MKRKCVDFLNTFTVDGVKKNRLKKLNDEYDELDKLSDKEVRLEIVWCKNKYTHMKLQLTAILLVIISFIFSKVIESTTSAVINIMVNSGELSMMLSCVIIAISTSFILFISMLIYFYIMEMKQIYRKWELLQLIDKTRN